MAHTYYYLVVATCLLATARVSLQVPATFHMHRPLQLPDMDSLKEIFVGRCEEYQLVLHSEFFRQPKNCDSLWETFKAAAFTPSYGCIPKPSAFGGLLELADHTLPSNTFVFWSGVYDVIVKMQLLPIFFPISKTLMGHTMDSLSWCKGNCSNSEFEEASAESLSGRRFLQEAEIAAEVQSSEADCNNFTLPFWISASQWYARKASGRISVVLNASLPSPFRESSIFGQYELPLISSSKVTAVDIFTVGSLTEISATGACDGESVMKLRETLRRKGIPVRCEENPEFILHLLCADDPKALRCRLKGVGTLLPSLRWTAAAAAFAAVTIFTALSPAVL